MTNKTLKAFPAAPISVRLLFCAFCKKIKKLLPKKRELRFSRVYYFMIKQKSAKGGLFYVRYVEAASGARGAYALSLCFPYGKHRRA
jgi:hypothetical protein